MQLQPISEKDLGKGVNDASGNGKEISERRVCSRQRKVEQLYDFQFNLFVASWSQ